MATRNITSSALRLLGSNKFFAAIIILFTLQASWIALTGLYPQAFDEQYHFGVAQLHAQQWSPFFAHQPAGADQYGALARDPSILYHYLLGLLYRVVAVFTSNQPTQIVVLRFSSVLLGVWTLFLFRRLFRLLELSATKTNLVILFFSLLPVYTLLAGQLSYDNALIPVTALTIIWAVELAKTYQKTKRFDWLKGFRLLVAMMLFSTIKFAYLPIFAGVVLYFLPMVWKARKGSWRQFTAAFSGLRPHAKAAYVAAAVIALGLFGGGLGYNLVHYHEPDPYCEKVLRVEQCMKFGPYARDHAALERHEHPSGERLVAFPFRWTKNMIRESYFTVYSYFDSEGVVHYYGGQKVPQLYSMGWVWFVTCLVILIVSARWLWGNMLTRLVLVVGFVYTASVFYIDLKAFYGTSYMVAVHGRYLFPVIVPILGCVALGLGHLVSRLTVPAQYRARQVMLGAAILTVLGFTQGGGLMTYIHYSGDGSFWHQSTLAQEANAQLRKAVDAVIIGQ